MLSLPGLCSRLAGLTTRHVPGLSATAASTTVHGSSKQGTSSLLTHPHGQGTSLLSRCMASLSSMHRNGPRKVKKRIQAPALEGCPQKRGVVLKVLVKKPKKPNSANRKCVRLRLTNGKEATAFVPGEGHNLQEHSVVLVYGARLQDVPGVKLACVRGKYDLAHVKRKD